MRRSGSYPPPSGAVPLRQGDTGEHLGCVVGEILQASDLALCDGSLQSNGECGMDFGATFSTS